MKKGQLLSQPFIYIFAIIVIGLILIFGFRYVGKLLKVGCQVETLGFSQDIQAKVNELVSLSYGSSFECALVRASGQSGHDCEFVIPDNVAGICFVDTTKSYDEKQIPFKDAKEIIIGLGRTNKNLFFSTKSSGSCKAEPIRIQKLTTNGVVCIGALNRTASFIMENTANVVEIRKS